jgi:hypothetical protein
VGTVVCDRLASRVGAKVGGFQNYDVPGLTPLLRAFLSHYQAWDKEQTADEAARQAAAAQVRTDRQERAARVLSAFGLREVVENQERLDALLGHLNEPANRDHYHFAIASERKMLFAASEDALRLVTAGVLEALPVGSLGGRFAVPVRLPAGTAFQAGFEAVRQALARQVLPDAREHVLPTAALYSEAIVGSCNSAEPEALERFRVETQRRTLDNDLQKLEACRLQARLDAQPPLLDKDPAPSPHLDVDLNPATATTPSTS